MKKITHRGAHVRDVIILNGYTIQGVANKLGKYRTTLTKWFTQEDLDYKYIKLIGDAINYDYTSDFPEMEGIYSHKKNYTKEKNLREAEDKLKFWMDEVYRLSMANKALEQRIEELEGNLQIAAEPKEGWEKKKGA